jgi:ribosomal protein S18 acetylase RimI-like enzyme
MASFSIDLLPNPAPDHDTLLEYSARFKRLRLRALKEDSRSFISKYENEVAQQQDFWLNRLMADRVVHLVLAQEDGVNTNKTLLQKQWVGFVVISAAPNNQALDSSSPAEWYMAAAYIEPEVRGQGLGKRLVQATIDYIKDQASTEDSKHVCCSTSVRHGNDNALELYQRLGFRIIDPNKRMEKDGKEYLVTDLRIDLQWEN